MSDRNDDGGFDERTVMTRTEELELQPQPHLVVLTGDRPGRHVPIRDRVLIGRGVDCDLHMDTEDISRKHAEVRIREEGGFVVEDLGSQNGTWVNGLPVEVHPLEPGDRIRLGGRTLVMLSLHGDLEEQLLHQQRMESLGVLAGGIAHDFNNLMAVVLGNAEYLEAMPPEARDEASIAATVADLKDAARHAADLTRQLLSLARRAPMAEQVIDVQRLVGEVVRMLRRNFGRDIEVEIEVAEPLVLVGDPSQLRQVLLNLCVNARDAMPDGGKLRIVGRRETGGTTEEALLEVSDTGMGMDPEACGRIFEPFYTRKAFGRGTGLGLAIVKRIVENHGGSVLAQSKLNEGSTFHIRLPIRTRADRATPPTMPQPSPIARDGAPLKTLIIDDDALHARALHRNLDGFGYRTLHAESGQEGLRVLQAMPLEFGLVIIDVDLAGLGALETCRAIRKGHPEVKILLASGAVPEDQERWLEGVVPDGILAKPYDRAGLRAEVIRLIG